MSSRRFALVRTSVVSALGLTAALVMTTGAEARHHRMRAGSVHHRHSHIVGLARHHAAPVDSPAFAAMVVDANSGRTLYANHENDLRHPASITKVMTLYLLFEKLDAGDMRLDQRIGVSAHAASMAPTKLGLRPGSTIAVEDAIKAIVTKSANDMAVAVGESIAGDEASFAAEMTRKAHALGMSRTIYVNASGLPDDRQITTARDLTILGRSIHDRFPRYYRYFSTPSFTYAGSVMPNHNHLMARIEGMDGIKTGYTRASGFNLLSSVNRAGHHIVSVVLGGRSAASRDNIMASLIEEHLEEAAPTRVADAVAPSPVEEPAPTVQPAAYGRSAEDDADRGPSLIAPTFAVPPPARPNDRAQTLGQAMRNGAVLERPRPAFIAGASRMDGRRAEDGSTSARPMRAGGTDPTTTASVTPSTIRTASPPSPPAVRLASLSVPRPPARPVMPAPRTHAEESRAAETPSRDRTEPGRGHGPWIIQIGATDAADKATDLLNRARSQGSGALVSARPFTEKVRKGDATLYRARFAGLDTTEAEQACRTLKRSGFACFATKD